MKQVFSRRSFCAEAAGSEAAAWQRGDILHSPALEQAYRLGLQA